MGDHHSDDQLRNQVEFPKVYVNPDHDFASVKLADGIEAKSYIRNGLAISEDQDGNIIEIQILNLSQYKGALPHTG